MGILDCLILAAVALCAAAAMTFLLRARKKGKCVGCSGCSSCSGCSERGTKR
ncbi:MAG: FeoB-associated Cys-rich membrane protein [Oscillospiraceae bacterium]